MSYDLVIIGSGWAGLNAAFKAKELGLKTAIVEKGPLGGTCLNQGCIPAKTLIQSAKVYSLIKKAQTFGIENASGQLNFSKIQERKEKIILQLRQGIESLLKGVDIFNAEASFISNQELKAGAQNLKSKFFLIATGSKAAELSSLKFTDKILSSNEILNLNSLPGSLLVVGGGVIGCEFASLFSSLGSRVTIIEKMPQLLPGEDKETAKKLETIFKKKGVKVNTSSDAGAIDLKDYEAALVCVGRAALTEGLNLENLGIKLERGSICVDDYLKTNIPNIYAAGDCTGKTMLAHFAAYQGSIAAENIAYPDKAIKADNKNIPNCIFSDPQIASIGLKEEEAQNKGIAVKIHKFDFLGSGMARIMDEAEGFIKIISEGKTGEVIGASIIGPAATELIAVLTLGISNRLNVKSIRDTIFAHPTLSESIHEALK